MFPPILFVFLISLMHHHHPALLHCKFVVLGRLLTFLMTFFILVLKPSFCQSLSSYSHLSLAGVHLPELVHSVFGSHRRGSVGECGRLSQFNWLLAAL